MKTVSSSNSTPRKFTVQPLKWCLLGLALGSLLAALVSPATGWLVRAQFRRINPLDSPTISHLDLAHLESEDLHDLYWKSPIHAAACRQHNDVEVQAADALVEAITISELDMMRGQQVDAQHVGLPGAASLLQGVVNRFPDNPTPAALYLRYALDDTVKITGLELYGRATPIRFYDPSHPPVVNRTASLRKFEEVARRGEQLDPTNAYFPMLLSLVHFIDDRGAEALNDLDQAARRPTWNDYASEEMRGKYKLNQEMIGSQSSLLSEDDFFANFAPFQEQIQNLWLLALRQATYQEKQGHIEAGIAIRSRLMRLAVLMRDQSHASVMVEESVNLFAMAASQLGTVNIPPAMLQNLASYSAPLMNAYQAYLLTHHFPSEATWCSAQREAFAHLGTVRPSDPFESSPLLFSWGRNLYLLIECLLFTLLGGLLSIHFYRRRFRPIPSTLPSAATRWGIALGLLIPGLLLLSCDLIVSTNANEAFFALALFCSALLLATAIVKAGESRVQCRMALRTFLGFCGTLVLLSWLANGLKALLFEQRAYFVELPWVGDIEVSLAMAQILLIMPLVATYVMAVACRIQFQPFSVGFLPRFQRAIAPMLSLLIFAYIGTLVPTLLHEQEQRNITLQYVQNETAYSRQARPFH